MPEYTIDHILDGTVYTANTPRRRQPLDALPRAEQQRAKRYYAVIKPLVDELQTYAVLAQSMIETAAKTLGIRPFEVIEQLQYAYRYWNTYPDDAPEQAFSRVAPSSTKKVSRKKQTIPRKRPPLISVEYEEVERIQSYATDIATLLDMIGENRGRIPAGELQRVAIKWQQSPDWIERQLKHLRIYREHYSNDEHYTDAEAFTPLPKGRTKGRTYDSHIIDIIENAVLNQEWETVNPYGDAEKIKTPLRPREIHSMLVQTTEKPPSKRGVERVIKDVEQANPALYNALRTHLGTVRNNLPTIEVLTRGSWEQVQFDIRPLSIICLYKGIEVTLHAFLITDSHTDYTPVWYLLPAKTLAGGDVVSQTYTAQKVRQLLALAILRVGARPRVFYPDRGSQFFKSLEKYMSLLNVPNEPPTRLINRETERPRGGGNIENALKQLNQHIAFQKSYIHEKDFRRSLREKKKVQLPTYEQVVHAFDLFMNDFNHSQKQHMLSMYEQFKGAPQCGLSVPSLINLSLFANTAQTYLRCPNPDGFQIEAKRYVPLHATPEIYEQLGIASQRAKVDEGYEIPICMCRLDDSTPACFFSLDNKVTWHQAVEKGKRTITVERHSHLLRTIEKQYQKRGYEATLFTKELLENNGDPLVINSFRKNPTIEPLSQVTEHITESLSHPDRLVMPRDIAEDISVQETMNHSQPKQTRTKRKRASTSSPYQSAVHLPKTSHHVDVTPNDHDDDDEFLRSIDQYRG